MRIMNIFLIRHGQTLLNQTNTHQYSSTPLSKIGLREARNFANHLKSAKIDKIYSSPLLRAKQTAGVISRIWEKEYTVLDGLREIKKPSEIEGKSHNDPIVQQIKHSIKDKFSNENWHHSDEENFLDIKKRVLNIRDFLEIKKENNFLLITHSVIIKMFISLCLFNERLTTKEFLLIYEKMYISNTGITHCCFSIDLGWKVMGVNNTTHLITNS